jgi:hypothetical protein
LVKAQEPVGGLVGRAPPRVEPIEYGAHVGPSSQESLLEGGFGIVQGTRQQEAERRRRPLVRASGTSGESTGHGPTLSPVEADYFAALAASRSAAAMAVYI